MEADTAFSHFKHKNGVLQNFIRGQPCDVNLSSFSTEVKTMEMGDANVLYCNKCGYHVGDLTMRPRNAHLQIMWVNLQGRFN